MEPKILVPVDDSPTARLTVEAIIKLKQRFSKKLTLLYVINKEQLAYRMIPDFQLDMVQDNARKAGEVLLGRYQEQLEAEGFAPETILEFGNPRSMITSIANDQEFQLVVIGRREGSGEIRSVLFGSVANYVLHNVRCPVLLF
ncbi:MAG: universal stress protein [Desulfobulbaceae bacterium]|nr:MAG: universal stress protein [Desulfobulbaceae bacterium]